MNLNSCFFILSLLQRWRIFKCSNCKNKSIIDSLLKVALRCLGFKTPFPVDSRSLVDFPDNTSDQELLCQCKRLQRLRSDPGLGRSPGGGHHSPLQCSWRIPWTEEPGGLQFVGLQRVGHDWGDLAWMQHVSDLTLKQTLDLHFLLTEDRKFHSPRHRCLIMSPSIFQDRF